MRKIFYLSLCVMLAIACTQSPQKKAEALVKESVQKLLFFPDSYEAIETQLDSAFSPHHDPASVTAVLDFYKKGYELEELDSEIKSAKSSMSLWSGPYMTSLGKNEYNEAKEKYEKAQKQYESLLEKTKKQAEAFWKKMEEPKEFIGYKARHRYRAKNNAGNVMIGEMVFLFDKELTTVVAEWDKEEIELYNSFLEEAAEAAE